MPGFTLSLLYANRLRELLATLRGRYDRILIDSPPIIGVSDASLLAGRRGRRDPAHPAPPQPGEHGPQGPADIVGLKTPILGAVLTQVPKGSGEDYGYYTQAYSYYSEGDGTEKAAGASAEGRQAGPVGRKPESQLMLTAVGGGSLIRPLISRA